MIESIYQIGQAAQSGTQGRRMFLESLASEPPKPKKGPPTIAILKLDIASQQLDVQVKELDAEGENSSARYLYLGNAPAANDQDRITTDNPAYLLTQTVPNLLKRLRPESTLHAKLGELVDGFFLDLGEPDQVGVKSGVTYRRNRCFWDLERLGLDGISVETVKERMRETGDAKEIPKLVTEALYMRFGSDLGRDRMLFTLELDGELVVDDEAYQEYLENVLVDTVFEDAPHGICHLTGQEGPVTSNMTRFGFKYYITDKQGFAAGARPDGFGATLGLSKEAYKSLLVGERYVRRRLGFYLAGTNGYLLPDVYALNFVQEFQSNLDRALRAVKSRADLDLGIQQEVDQRILRVTERGNYALNLLFYRQNKANFKVLRLIQDVPAYRLQELRSHATRFTREVGGTLFGESRQWDLTMRNMYYLLPVRKKTLAGGRVEFLTKPVLEFYAALIGGGLVDRRELLDGFVELVNAYRFGNHASYHISEPQDPDYALVRYVIHTNLLLAYLRSLGQLKEEKNLDTDYLDELDLTDEQREYLVRLDYKEPPQTALYLLGTLIGEIANAQYRLGPGGKNGDKTILNKINYGGMTVSRVQRLATELFDKLTQYRDRNRRPLLQGRNEKVFAQAQAMLTEHRDRWPLNTTENVYYILSGYSHATLQAMRRRGTDADQTPDTIQEGADA